MENRKQDKASSQNQI